MDDMHEKQIARMRVSLTLDQAISSVLLTRRTLERARDRVDHKHMRASEKAMTLASYNEDIAAIDKLIARAQS